MATSEAPRHDFAPAWLKIPHQENVTPADSKSAIDKRSQKGQARQPSPGLDFLYSPLQRQRSLDIQYNGTRTLTNLRHHSVDEDVQSRNGYYDNGGGGGDRRDMTQRRHEQCNGNSSAEVFADVNGSTPFRKLTSYSKSEAKSGVTGRSRMGRLENRQNQAQNQTVVKPESIEEDFPSLREVTGDMDDKGSGVVKVSSVWAKPPLSRLTSDKEKSPSEDGQRCAKSPSGDMCSKTTELLYKPLVLKTGSVRKPQRDTPPATPTEKLTNGVHHQPSPVNQRQIMCAPLVITQPRYHVNKKSEFLRALRQQSEVSSPPATQVSPVLSPTMCKSPPSTPVTKLSHLSSFPTPVSAPATQMSPSLSPAVPILPSSPTTQSDSVANGSNNKALRTTSPRNQNENILSSSLEAEQRLLREMGWRETDDEDYEITDTDRLEFERLSKQLQQLKQDTNGVRRKSQSKASVGVLPWSPQHNMYNKQHFNDSQSSSDTDNDTL